MEFKIGDRVSHTYHFISDGTIIDVVFVKYSAYFHKVVNSNMFHVEFDNGTKFWMQSGEIKKTKQQKREERLNELGI
jgi:hypothetical protein